MANIVETAIAAGSFTTLVENARVIEADVMADNGVIHAIDRVILLEEL